MFGGIILEVILKTKIDWADLDYPHQELSNGGLESVVALLVRW